MSKELENCPDCAGHGYTAVQSHSDNMDEPFPEQCQNCFGTGKVTATVSLPTEQSGDWLDEELGNVIVRSHEHDNYARIIREAKTAILKEIDRIKEEAEREGRIHALGWAKGTLRHNSYDDTMTPEAELRACPICKRPKLTSEYCVNDCQHLNNAELDDVIPAILGAVHGGRKIVEAHNQITHLIEQHTAKATLEARKSLMDEFIGINGKQFNRWTPHDIANFFNTIGRKYRDIEERLAALQAELASQDTAHE